ncbi:MAG: sulfatase [Alphaproteobacteria bacterium]
MTHQGKTLLSRNVILPGLSMFVLAVMFVLALRDVVREEPLNVIVLTVESWRADTVTADGMPRLLAAAEAGVRFDRHRAVSAWTAPNIISVLTGVSPLQQGTDTRGDSLPPEYDVLTEQLSARGWRVAGLQAFMQIDLFRNLGFQYELGADMRSWLAGRVREKEPFFLWHHYLDTHLPYSPTKADEILAEFPVAGPSETARRKMVRTLPAIPDDAVAFAAGDRAWIEALYGGGIDDFDNWFGQFWAFFEQSGLRDTTVLIVTADHGEELLERGHVGHASTTRAGHLHAEIVRVPMFVWAPKDLLPVPPGTVVDRPTDHRMIAPTLAAMLGFGTMPEAKAPDLFDARSALAWAGFSSRAGFSETDPENVNAFVLAGVEGDLKVHVTVDAATTPGIEAWDLARDPGERMALNPRPAEADRIAAQLLRDFAVRRLPPAGDGGGDVSRGSVGPSWVRPKVSRRIGYQDIAEATYLAWTGDPNAGYVVEYQAGTGLLSLSGELEVEGTRHDFGPVSRKYWETWVVPYKSVRFRVRPSEASESWSAWLELELER